MGSASILGSFFCFIVRYSDSIQMTDEPNLFGLTAGDVNRNFRQQLTFLLKTNALAAADYSSSREHHIISGLFLCNTLYSTTMGTGLKNQARPGPGFYPWPGRAF